MNANLLNANRYSDSIFRLFFYLIIHHSVFRMFFPAASMKCVPLHVYFSVCCLLPCAICTAQQNREIITYARGIIDTLCSPNMHGRGYINKGDSIAADYIKKKFEEYKLKSFGTNYYQNFYISVNVIKNINRFIWGDLKDLTPGKNYQVLSFSSSAISWNLPSKIVWIDSTTFYSKKRFQKFIRQKNLSDKYVVVNIKQINEETIAAAFNNVSFRGLVFLEYNKLTSNVSSYCYQFPAIEILITDSINVSVLSKNKFIDMSFDTEYIPMYKSQNVIGYIPGTQYPDSFIVFSAHYDHLGRMGKNVYFPGANDNASGCAMLLNLAKYYSENPQRYSIAFFAFGAEEIGLLGSKYYVEHPLFPLKQIKFLINMDILGTGDEGITVVNGTEHKNEFEQLLKINEEKKLLPQIKIRGKAANSDHYFFSQTGVKSFFIYTLGGIKAYHDIYDRPQTLPLTKFEEIYKLLIEFSEYLQK